MIAEALQLLIATLAREPVVHPHPSGSGGLVTVPNGCELHHIEGPVGSQRTHLFEDITSFADWLNRHAKPDKAEILVALRFVTAGLDPTTTTCDRVDCALALHPIAHRWAKVLGTQLTQRELHRLIVSAVDDFPAAEGPRGGDLGSYGTLLAEELTKLEVVRHGEYQSILDPRGFYAFKGGSEQTTVAGKLPSSFTVTIPWFLAVNEVLDGQDLEVECRYKLEVALEMDTTEPRNPTFLLRATGIELLKYNARLDAVEWLRCLLNDEFLVGMGTYGTHPKPLIEPVVVGAGTYKEAS